MVKPTTLVGMCRLMAIFTIAVPAALAQEQESKQTQQPDYVPSSTFYGGVGLGLSSTGFGNQYVYNRGTSEIYKNGVLTSTGVAEGPAIPDPFLQSSSGVAPAAQVGYTSRFGTSSWLWGAKLTYAYLGNESSPQVLAIPQEGSSSSSSIGSFSGTSYNTYSIRANNQFALMPFVGRSFGRGFIYGGAGVALTQVQTSLNDVVGFATFNGVNTNVSGSPQNFSKSQWASGVAATAGLTYFLSRSVFLDLSYTYSKPNATNLSISGQPFSNPSANPSDPSFYGTLNGNATSNLTTNIVSLTINTRF